MKRIGKALLAMAMMVGAFGATGCKKSDDQRAAQDSAPVAQPAEAQPASEATKSAAPVAQEESRTVFASTATVKAPAPPALRFETQGTRPSAHHVWQRGYWRWDTPRTVYMWVPGYWEDTYAYAPSAPPAPRYEDCGDAPSVDYVFVSGFWRWSGREYTWMYGHWSPRREVAYYYRPRWEYTHGRWENRMERLDERRDFTRPIERREIEHREAARPIERREPARPVEHREVNTTTTRPIEHREVNTTTTRPIEHRAPIVNRTAALPQKRGHG
jgi:hypothetical protein